MAWVCDWYTLIAISDQMLQTVHNGGESKGYLAYGADQNPEAKTAARLRKWAEWWEPRRVTITRVLLVVGWPPVIICCKAVRKEGRKEGRKEEPHTVKRAATERNGQTDRRADSLI